MEDRQIRSSSVALLIAVLVAIGATGCCACRDQPPSASPLHCERGTA